MSRLRPPDPVVARAHLAGLESKIAAAFVNGIRSTEVATLIQQVEVAIRSASETAVRAREKALDPTLNGSELNSARQTMHDSGFQVERLQAASSRLRQRLAELKAAEANARKRERYDEVAQQRDALATKLATIYPPFVEKLAHVLAEVAANDAEVAFVNTNENRPAGAPVLQGAELKARGLQHFRRGVVEVPRLTANVTLPKWKPDDGSMYLWPLKWGL
jgi:hypothetical protein